MTNTKEIRFDRLTRDWSMYLNGRYVGSRNTSADARAELDRLVYEELRRAA